MKKKIDCAISVLCSFIVFVYCARSGETCSRLINAGVEVANANAPLAAAAWT
jgi:hypothetical protein